MFTDSPRKSILDQSFPYVPAAATNVAMTWQRYGFSAQANAERRARLRLTANVRNEAREVAQLHDLFLRVAAAREAA